MVFIYDENTKNIEFFYSGDTSQINLARKHTDKKISEVIFPDDKDVESSPRDYELVFENDVCVSYQKKKTKTPLFEMPKPKEYLAIIEIQSILEKMGYKLEYKLE